MDKLDTDIRKFLEVQKRVNDAFLKVRRQRHGSVERKEAEEEYERLCAEAEALYPKRK